jgi:HEPN domain-containing protein
MKETVKEWIEKANADYATAGREVRARDNPNYDAVCFHAQQCIEKLMKGLLIQLGALPPKSHDLIQLGNLLTNACQEWEWPVEELRYITRAAVDYRYPGESADKREAEEAFEIARRMREKLLKLFE